MFKCNVQHSRTNQLISIVRAKKNRSLPFLVFRGEKNQTVHVSKCENLNKFFESVLHCKGKQRHLSHDQIKNCTKKTIRKMFIIDVIKRNTLDMVRFGSAHFSCLCVSLLILLNCLARCFFSSLYLRAKNQFQQIWFDIQNMCTQQYLYTLIFFFSLTNRT